MDKRKHSWQFPVWLDTLLRWWWWVYFSMLVLSIVSDMIFTSAQNGPGALLHYFDKYGFLVHLEHAYTALFWSVFSTLTLSAVAGRLLSIIDWWEGRQSQGRWRLSYLHAIDEEYQVIPLVIDPDNVQQLPEMVYQKLKYQNDPARPLDEASATQGSLSSVEVDDIDQVLAASNSRSMIILGRPGGGKTTLLRHSMSKIARQISDRPSAYLPVFLSLPRLAPLLLQRQEQAVALYLRQNEQALIRHGLSEYAEYLQAIIQRGEAFLFLDGLDEVDPGYQSSVKKWIVQQQLKLNLRGSLVVSTRFTDYSRNDFISGQTVSQERQFAEFSEWVVQSMDHDIRMKLATNLLPALSEQFKKVSPEKLQDERLMNPALFVKRIEQHQQGVLWGGSPLLFSLAAFVYIQEDGELPSSRVTLYERSITTLLAKIVRFRQQTDSPSARESGLLREIGRVLAEVALRLFETESLDGKLTRRDEAQSFTEEILLTKLEEIRDDFAMTYTSADMATWIISSGTLEVIKPKEKYQFRHHTYQEYLVAKALAQRLVSRNKMLKDAARALLQEKRFIPIWSEPMRMLAGALVAEGALGFSQSKQIAKNWLEDLIALATHLGDQHCYAALELAVASLPEIPGIDAFGQEINISTLLTAWAESLLRMGRTEQNEWLERLQRLAPGVASLPSVLVQPALARLQRALMDESQPDEQIAAARALEGMGDFVDVSLLAQVLFQGNDGRTLFAVARALAKLERSDLSHPGHSVLQQGLIDSDVVLARIIAGSLVEAGDIAYPLMIVAIEKERDAQVRRLGVLALGGIGLRAREVLSGLLGDSEPDVATTAAEMLNRLGENLDTLLPRLTLLARQGASATAIARAVQASLPYTLRQLGFLGQILSGIAIIIPPVCKVPAGTFLIGSDKKSDPRARDDEMPQQQITLSTFHIGMYPVTVAEYACAVRASVVREPQNWTNQSKRLDHPVVGVTRSDALTYAQWMAQVTGQTWRLPTEAEWEKAARGVDGRIYPWGNKWDRTRANTSDGGFNDTSPVGAYSDRGDASPYGAHDMAGNVWEWCSTLYRPYPYDMTDGREDVNNRTSNPVQRGGSFGTGPGYARCAARADVQQPGPEIADHVPDYVDDDFGFRLLVVKSD